MDPVLLHVSDWNLQDKWYELSLAALKEFRERALKGNLELAGDWLVQESGAKRCDEAADHTLEEYFFDYTNPDESLGEWEIED